ncbi:MAG: ribosomal-processing cysteine protease Prp [Lachnospiraceae bacterium]|jgi:hypothetical protein|nr:ribosomal-processing cysteine protease Prp [Lachnospiraceae bacterium]MCI1657333.1 ribosomal-processing cysteine protease Prp [Lachnospiraceae bacterium]MCI2195811.1 ribosomal-processing cysteine protease Prp [Lachnospiraceae bacterium]
MISVAVSDCEVIVSGHAGYAPPGNDIICAAVSALTQSLASSLEALTEAKQIQGLIPVMSVSNTRIYRSLDGFWWILFLSAFAELRTSIRNISGSINRKAWPGLEANKS